MVILYMRIGIVLVRCGKCEKLHLVADNLSIIYSLLLEWFEDKEVNIEELQRREGQSVKKVSTNEDILEFIQEVDKLNDNE